MKSSKKWEKIQTIRFYGQADANYSIKFYDKGVILKFRNKQHIILDNKMAEEIAKRILEHTNKAKLMEEL